MLPLIVYRRPIQRRIRVARPEDKDIVTEIANRAFAPKDRTLWINGAFGRSDRTIYVLEHYGGVQAFIIMRAEGSDWRVDLIGVNSPRLGYGRDLMKYVEYVSPVEFEELVAGTHADNDGAQQFYHSQGFACWR